MTVPEDIEQVQTVRRPFWKARSLLIALSMVLLGLWMWDRNPPETGPQAGTPRGSAGFAEASPAKAEPIKAAKPRSPALFRFGASYIVGFFFGWTCRKSIKIAMLLAGAAALAIAVAKQTGVIELDWAGLQAHVSQSLAWLHGELGALKHFVLGYIPSAAAGCVGIFMGARRS